MAFRISLRPQCFRSFVSSSLSQQCRKLSVVDASARDDIKFYPVYVHHLSKVVLEHFEKKHSDWIIERNLDTGLKFNADGTFVLHFPGSKGRIWTSYDAGKKHHWLSVYKDGTLERFLMKDASDVGRVKKETVNTVVRASVDKLVATLDSWAINKT